MTSTAIRDRIVLAPAQRARLWTLWAGFAALLLLMCLLAADSAWSLRELASTSLDLRQTARQRDELTDRLREDIYHSGTLLRDYLVESNPDRAAVHRLELEKLRVRIESHLAEYSRAATSAGEQPVVQLAAGVRTYLNALSGAMAWDPADRRARGDSFLRDVVIPGRNQLVELAGQITQISKRDLDAAETRVAALHWRFGLRVIAMSCAAVIFGVVLAWLIMRRVSSLERDSALRYSEMEDARKKLARLSELLVNAQEEERRNIARELHDEVAQSLSAALVDLTRIGSASSDAEPCRERLVPVRQSLEYCLRNVRDMALLLRPSMLDDLGLTAALRWQVREVMRRGPLRVRLIADESVDDLPDACKTCVYRFVQETLNNCAKHAQAGTVRVLVRRDDCGLAVTVHDDGIGFDPNREKGLGLLGIAERVERLRGVFSVESEPGHGTVVAIRLPLLESNAATA